MIIFFVRQTNLVLSYQTKMQIFSDFKIAFKRRNSDEVEFSSSDEEDDYEEYLDEQELLEQNRVKNIIKEEMAERRARASLLLALLSMSSGTYQRRDRTRHSSKSTVQTFDPKRLDLESRSSVITGNRLDDSSSDMMLLNDTVVRRTSSTGNS